MAKKFTIPQKTKKKSKKSPKKFTGFYKSNGKQTTQKTLYDVQLAAKNPVSSTLNYGY